MRSIAGDATRITWLVEVEQADAQLGEGEQIVSGLGEEIEILAGESGAYGNEPLVVHQPTQAPCLVMP